MNNKKTGKVKIKKRRSLSLQDKAMLALKEAVKEVLERHKKTGRPLIVWQNGKVVKLSPFKISNK